MFDPEKALNVVLYVVGHLGDTGPHQVFKTLYFAEREHLARYGSPVLSDTFIRMEYGPVPSAVYNLVKALRGELGLPLDTEFAKKLGKSLVAPSKRSLRALAAADLDYLAESERESLDNAIANCRGKKFPELSNQSHDEAWHRVEMNREMRVLDIARAGGADEAMLAYIRTVYENQALVKTWAA